MMLFLIWGHVVTEASLAAGYSPKFARSVRGAICSGSHANAYGWSQ